MKKPLQPRNEFAEAFNNSFARYQGHIQILTGYDEKFGFIYRNTGDLSYLLETVNQALVNRDSKDASFAHQFGLSLINWLEKFLKKGFTTQMLQELRGETQGLRFFHFLNPAIPSRGQPLPHWNFIADTEAEIDAKKMAAYAFAQQLTLNGFVNLKRCHLKGCQNFFIGRSNTKWCSKSCGSFYRVREKRKKDKN